MCKICGVESLIVNEGSRAGLASSVSLSCSNTDCATLSSHSLVPKTNQYFFLMPTDVVCWQQDSLEEVTLG